MSTNLDNMSREKNQLDYVKTVNSVTDIGSNIAINDNIGETLIEKSVLNIMEGE